MDELRMIKENKTLLPEQVPDIHAFTVGVNCSLWELYCGQTIMFNLSLLKYYCKMCSEF